MPWDSQECQVHSSHGEENPGKSSANDIKFVINQKDQDLMQKGHWKSSKAMCLGVKRKVSFQLIGRSRHVGESSLNASRSLDRISGSINWHFRPGVMRWRSAGDQ